MTHLPTLVRQATTLALALTACASMALAQQKITNPKVGKPLAAAQEAFNKKQWDVALAKLNEADRSDKKSAYEQYAINEFKGAVFLQKGQYGEAAPLFERNLDSGFVPAANQVNALDNLILMYMQLRNYPKVTAFGDRWLKAGGSKVRTRALVGQAYYAQKSYKRAIEVLEGAIKETARGGGTPEENWLNIVRSAYQNLGDTAGTTRSMEELVRYYPKPEFWDFLLSSRMRQNNTDRVQLNLFRLARQVGTLTSPDEYVEMTEILLDSGLPGEASAVMEAGYQANAFASPDKARADRYARRRAEARTMANKDQQSLPAFERDAQKAPTGQGSVALGLAYASFGQYDKAVAALNAGIQKGGVRDLQQAQLTLGLANLKLGKKADAIKAFESVKGDAPMEDVARLWVLAARSGA